MTLDTLIAKAGGVLKAANALGVHHSTICDWKRVGFVPGARLPQVRQAFDLTADEAMSLAKPPSAEAAS